MARTRRLDGLQFTKIPTTIVFMTRRVPVRNLTSSLMGPIKVNGKKYTPAAVMPGLKDAPQIDNTDLADVSNLIRHAWGNNQSVMKIKIVKATRKKLKGRQTTFTPAELKKVFS
jgi:hypothetical protein